MVLRNKRAKLPETINFHSFMKKDYKKKRGIFIYGILPSSYISISSLFSPPPLIFKAYLLITSVGSVLIIAALLEYFLVLGGYTELASKIIDFFKAVMPLALIGALVYFVLANPLF